MDEATKKRLKDTPRKECSKCGKKRTYINPITKCFECGKNFCFDHIFGGQINNSMSENDKIRDICKICKDKFNYKPI